MSAADEYRGVVEDLTAGFTQDTERNAGRVKELRDGTRELYERLVAASEQHAVARVGNILAWEDALEILWVEQWMTMRPFPRPDRLAKGAAALDAIAAVEARVAALRAAVARGAFGLPRRR